MYPASFQSQTLRVHATFSRRLIIKKRSESYERIAIEEICFTPNLCAQNGLAWHGEPVLQNQYHEVCIDCNINHISSLHQEQHFATINVVGQVAVSQLQTAGAALPRGNFLHAVPIASKYCKTLSPTFADPTQAGSDNIACTLNSARLKKL